MARAARDTPARPALEASSLGLDRLLTRSRDLFCLVGRDGRLERVNPSFERLLGWPEERLLGRSIVDLAHPEDAEQTLRAFARAASGSDEHGFEIRVATRDGGCRSIEWTATPLLDQGVVAAIGRDVTERRGEGSARFRASIEGGFEAFYVLAAEPDGAFRIVELNSRGAALLGRAKDELIGRRFDELGLPDVEVARFVDRFRGVHESGTPLEDEYETADDHCLQYQVVPLPEGVAVSARDITARRRAERERTSDRRALHQSQQRFLSVVQSVPGAFFTIVPCDDEAGEFRIDFLSDNVEAFTGHPTRDFHGPERITIEGLLVPEDRPVLRGAEERAQQGAPYAIDVRLRHADGSIRWVHVKGQPLLDDTGEPCGSGGVMLDITDRHLAEQALQESEARLRGVFASVPGVFFRAALDDGGWRVIYASEHARDLLGIEPDTLHERTFASLVHPGDRLLFEEAEAGLARGQAYEIDFRVVVDGETRWVREVSRPETDAKGRVTASSGFLFDITERKAAEEALRLRERALQTFTMGVVIVDARMPETPIVYVNPAFEQLTGYTAGEVLGRNASFLDGPETDPTAIAAIKLALVQGEPFDGELVTYRKDGTPFASAIRLSPVHDEAGVLTHFISLHTDETPRRRLEEQFLQAQKMEAVGRLAGGVAHDFNNMLLVIRGYSHVLMSMLGETRDGWSEAREIELAATRASELIRQLLAFSRSQVLQTQVANLNDIVLDTQKLLEPLIGEAVELRTSLDGRLAPVKADVSQLEQAIVNVVVNARDAMPDGGRLLLRTRNVVVDGRGQNAPGIAPGAYAALSVEDTGHGMDEETKARIFEPFFSTKGGTGSGLGLSSAYGIVKQSGGEITVVSAPGEGTSITLYLPQAREALPEIAAGPRELASGGAAETVLLVEDDEKARTLVGRLLRESGYSVHEAAAPEEALRFCDAHEGRIHLLLSDVVMPQMSGPTLAKQVLTLRPGTPVLFVSGYIERAADVDVVSSGADFLQKPFTPHELIETVRRVLDREQVVA